MKKLKINGTKLRNTISNMSISIRKAAEEKGGIGEKTIHRLLNGEAINENVVLKLFQNLGLNYLDYLENNSSDEIKDDDKSEIELTKNPNYKIVLKKFELPHSSYLPLEMIWVFDFTNPNEEVLNNLKALNECLTDYCNADKIKANALSFDSSFLRLSSTNNIENYINNLASNGVYAYSAVYKVWDSKEVDERYEDLRYSLLYLDSRFQLALYFTKNNNVKNLIALVNVGQEPPQKIPDNYRNIIVDGSPYYYDDKGELIEIPF